MAFCRKCGSQIDDEAVICPKCGVQQNTNINVSDNVIGSTRNTNGIAALGIFLPLIGWIVYAIMDKTALKSKDLLSGNILGTIIYVVLFIIWQKLK
ncbi:zinc ribbon domain-containing protein [uncultured Ruminococcus sp.]|uniref:zinc ribbon domain-containing protein n=1 Tax=uncultured Ruminococcus sp. TaxID=165186 RepID=UPI00261991A7|nr:zinc ribbon domain-containing protein [uncultured Ruminococcus sp.]